MDPFTDSIELEYGGLDFTDAGSRPRPHSNTNSQRQNRPLSQIMEEPVDNGLQDAGQTGFDTGYMSESGDFAYTSGSHVMGHVTGGYMPPPTYQAALDGSDGAVSSEKSSNQSDSSGEGGLSGTGRYWLRQRR